LSLCRVLDSGVELLSLCLILNSDVHLLRLCSISDSGAHLSRFCSVFCKTFNAVLDFRQFLQKKPSSALIIEPDMETEAKNAKHCFDT